jgi:hypothetical protein
MAPPQTVAHTFEVRFERAGIGRSMVGKGTLRFADDALHLEGWRSPNPLIQIGIVLALTFIPLLVLKIGLDLLPALIIAHYVGRKRLSFAIP